MDNAAPTAPSGGTSSSNRGTLKMEITRDHKTARDSSKTINMVCGRLVIVSPKRKMTSTNATVADLSYVSVKRKGMRRGASKIMATPHGTRVNTKNLVSVAYASRTSFIRFSE